jgi:hypothetical protein
MNRFLLTLALVLVPSTALAGGGGHGGPCASFAEGDTVLLQDFCFDGVAHFAETGTLTIRNAGGMPHDYTDVDGAFGTGVLQPGETAIIDVEPGTYRVYCTLHASRDGHGMAGGLAVGEPLDAEPAAASSTTLPWAPLALLAVGLGVLGAQRVRAARSASGSTS